jgi:hypothetical protein
MATALRTERLTGGRLERFLYYVDINENTAQSA